MMALTTKRGGQSASFETVRHRLGRTLDLDLGLGSPDLLGRKADKLRAIPCRSVSRQVLDIRC